MRAVVQPGPPRWRNTWDLPSGSENPLGFGPTRPWSWRARSTLGTSRMTQPPSKLILSIFSVTSQHWSIGNLALDLITFVAMKRPPDIWPPLLGGQISLPSWRRSNNRVYKDSCAFLARRDGHQYLWNGLHVRMHACMYVLREPVPGFHDRRRNSWEHFDAFPKITCERSIWNYSAAWQHPIRRQVDVRNWMCSSESWSAALRLNWWIFLLLLLFFSKVREHRSGLPCQRSFFHKFLNSKQNRGRKT